MKFVVCVNDIKGFTLGKLYNYYRNENYCFCKVKNDDGILVSILLHAFEGTFKHIEEIREEKLKALGI